MTACRALAEAQDVGEAKPIDIYVIAARGGITLSLAGAGDIATRWRASRRRVHLPPKKKSPHCQVRAKVFKMNLKIRNGIL
jgi:hypothetical protein